MQIFILHPSLCDVRERERACTFSQLVCIVYYIPLFISHAIFNNFQFETKSNAKRNRFLSAKCDNLPCKLMQKEMQ